MLMPCIYPFRNYVQMLMVVTDANVYLIILILSEIRLRTHLELWQLRFGG